MRILCTGDWQLGTGTDYGTPAEPRLEDQRLALMELGIHAQERGCEVTLHAGDVFEARRPSPLEYVTAQQALGHMPGEVHLATGNHDRTGPGVPASTEVLRAPQVHVYRDVGWCHLGLGVYLGVVSWAHPAQYRAARGHEGSVEGMVEALYGTAAGLYGLILEDFAREEPTYGEPGVQPTTVLLHHYGMRGFSLPNGLAVSTSLGLTEPVLDPAALTAQGWDWVVGGHIQRPEQDGNVLVVGSPYVCDFGEAHYDHGAYIIDTLERSAEWVPLGDRPFVTLDLPSPASWAGLELERAVVRVRWRGTEEAARALDVAGLRRKLYEHGASKVYAVQLDVERAERRRIEGLTEQTGAEEAMEQYIAHHEIPPEYDVAMTAEHAALLEEEA